MKCQGLKFQTTLINDISESNIIFWQPTIVLFKHGCYPHGSNAPFTNAILKGTGSRRLPQMSPSEKRNTFGNENTRIYHMVVTTHSIPVMAWFNSLAPGRFSCDFKNVIFNLALLIGISKSSYDNVLRWMPRDLTDDKSTLVQVMAWCRQATSHYLNQCWPRSPPPYDVIRPQSVDMTRYDTSTAFANIKAVQSLIIILDITTGFVHSIVSRICTHCAKIKLQFHLILSVHLFLYIPN